METLNYLLVAVLASLGIVAGAVLARIAKEELRAGEKYFHLLKKLFFAVAAGVLACSFEPSILVIVAGIIAITAYVAFQKKLPEFAVQAVLGAAFFVSSLSAFFPLFAAAVFAYGFPAGTLMAKEKKTPVQFALCVIVFIAVALLLHLLTKTFI